jgi:hypothetical protein
VGQFFDLRIGYGDAAVSPVDTPVDLLVTRPKAMYSEVTPQAGILGRRLLRQPGIVDGNVLFRT